MQEYQSGEKIIDFAKASMIAERYTSAIYLRLSESFGDSVLSGKLLDLGKEEGEHANFWVDFLERRDIATSNFSVNNYKIFFLYIIYRLLGIGLTLKILEIGEHNAIKQYSLMLKSYEISKEEKKGIRKILEDELRHEEEFEEYESRYKFFINRVATIFSQMSNGLVTVLSIAIGVAGISTEPFTIAITGLLVGLTGAISTITGFYFFNRTQRQVRVDILNRIKMAIDLVPHIFIQRVIKYMKRKDIREETAKTIANETAVEKKLLYKVVAEEEYGIKEEALGNPLKTALYAGLFRIIGTILPLTPYFLNIPITMSIPLSILITVLSLSVTGFLVALSAEIDIKSKIVELTFNGLVLATLSFLIGKLTSTLRQMLI